MLTLTIFTFISLLLFFIGFLGIILNRKHVLTMLMLIEVMLLSVNLNFISASYFHDDLIGQIFSLFILTVAAAESAIGLAILVSYYRIRNTILIENINLIKN